MLNNQLTFALLISTIIHLIVGLAIDFEIATPPTNKTPHLAITLVQHKTTLAPEQADFLAQANNQGSGVSAPEKPELPINQSLSPEPVTQAPPAIIESPVTEVLPAPMPAPIEVPQQVVKVSEKPKQQVQQITQAPIEQKVSKTAKPKATEPAIPPPSKPKLSAQQLMLQARASLADLQSQPNLANNAMTQQTNKRHISAATKEFAAAAYLNAWAMKVKRIGNMNYPQQAKQQNINGSLILTVDIQPDGNIAEEGIVIKRSSGYPILDQAAINIVRLGAPYAAVPANVLGDYELLTITRTWRFETSQGLSGR